MYSYVQWSFFFRTFRALNNLFFSKECFTCPFFKKEYQEIFGSTDYLSSLKGGGGGGGGGGGFGTIINFGENSVNCSILSPLLVAFACFGRGWVGVGLCGNYQNIESERDAT